jgi:hypothetical protein
MWELYLERGIYDGQRCSRGADAGRLEGSYGSYVGDLKRWKGPDADQPHRVAQEAGAAVVGAVSERPNVRLRPLGP